MQQPFFSIIIPTLNEELFLPKLLFSLSKQTERDFEVIVVDGKSKDKTVSEAHTFDNRLPKLSIVSSPVTGVSAQRNSGAKQALGQWLIFLDADSVLLPYALERMKHYITTEKPQYLTSWFIPDGRESGDSMFTLVANMFVESSIIVHRPLVPGTFFAVEKKVFEHVSGFDESIKWGEDYDLTARLTKLAIHMHIIRETLYMMSFRRIRREGRMKFLQTYAKASILLLLTKRNFREMPGYIMGGHVYSKKKNTKGNLSELRKLQQSIRSLMKKLW